MSGVKSDIEIARDAKMKPINEVLSKINVPDDPISFSPMGRHIAKLNIEYIDKLKEKKGNLILVTAITPTPAGEGKTTTSVGLSDGLNKIGKKLTQQRINIMIYSYNNYKTNILGFDAVVSLVNNLCRQKLNCAQDHIE